MSFSKGKVHQFTFGAMGLTKTAPICTSHKTRGKFYYTQNKQYAFGLVSVTDKEFKVKFKGSVRIGNSWIEKVKTKLGFKYEGVSDMFEVTVTRRTEEDPTDPDEIEFVN